MPLATLDTELLSIEAPGALALAVRHLRAGRPVVFPTDTVYGIGVDPFNPTAVAALYAAKERPADKGLPILLANRALLSQVAVAVPPVAERLIAAFWPGPLTLILPRRPDLPANLSPNAGIGVRVPDNPHALRLLLAAGGALAASSANRSGGRPAQTARAARQALRGRVALILDGGPAPRGAASTVVDCTVSPPRILRQGPIDTTHIEAIF